jgi:hypothetical protein
VTTVCNCCSRNRARRFLPEHSGRRGWGRFLDTRILRQLVSSPSGAGPLNCRDLLSHFVGGRRKRRICARGIDRQLHHKSHGEVERLTPISGFRRPAMCLHRQCDPVVKQMRRCWPSVIGCTANPSANDPPQGSAGHRRNGLVGFRRMSSSPQTDKWYRIPCT